MTAETIGEAVARAGRPLTFAEIVIAMGGDWRQVQATLLESIRAGRLIARATEDPRRPVYEAPP